MVPFPSFGRRPLDDTAARAGAAFRGAAFWVAVALPFVALTLLAFGGDLRLVVPLLACNAVALVVGHDHGTANRDH
jgi:fatty acid desaturase